MIAAPNGDVFVGNGDASSYCQADDSSFVAQDLNSPRGKIFRIDGDTGAGIAGNPWYDSTAPSSWRSRTFAMGLRNPFRIGLRAGHVDALHRRRRLEHLRGDQRRQGRRELRLALLRGAADASATAMRTSRPACSQYQSPPTNLRAPLWSWNHNNAGAASVGGDFYTATGDRRLPEPSTEGAYFFGDYAAGKIWTLRTDANDTLIRAPEANGFGSEIGAPVEFAAAPNGDMFYADIATSQVVRIRYSPGNRAPVAVATADRTAGPAPLAVQFDGDDSYDLDEEPITYAWDFGDGSTSTVANPTHTYAVDRRPSRRA